MERQRSAQEQLDALERDRQQVQARLLLPWWHHVGWGVTWCVFTVCTVLLTDRGWIFLVYGGTSVAFAVLWRARVRTQGLRLAPTKTPVWVAALHVLGGIASVAGMIALSLVVDSRWPLVVGNVALGVVVVVVSIRDERRQATRLRDER